MTTTEPQAAAPRPKRRWYRYTLWTLLVTEQHGRFRFSPGRLLLSFLFFGLAVASPAVVSWRFDYWRGAWAFLTGALICTLAGAAIGVLIAGGRGALGGAITAASLFIVALGVLIVSLIALFGVQH